MDYQLQLNLKIKPDQSFQFQLSIFSLYDNTAVRISKSLILLVIFSDHFSQRRLDMLFLYLDRSLL